MTGRAVLLSGLACLMVAAAARAADLPLDLPTASPAVSCPRDALAARCVLQTEDALPYPRSAVRAGKTAGTVLVRMDFNGPTGPPQTTVLYQQGGEAFVGAVERHLARSRLPCLAEGQQVSSVEAFQFEMEGAPMQAFPDMALQDFLPLVEGLSEPGPQFDFTAMSCPFDLRLKTYRPWAANVVSEGGAGDPQRAEFIAWLRGVTLKLPEHARGRLLGKELRLSVPCTQLDLR
jgi:hypothetical protein